MTWGFSIGLFIGVFVVSYAAVKGLRRQLLQRSVLDHPNERSSHVLPTPRGGGLAVVTVFMVSVIGLVHLEYLPVFPTIFLIAITGLLGGLSWLDDVYDLNALLRLVIHIGCVVIAQVIGVFDGAVFGGVLSPFADKFLSGLIWVWFINLFNFMDGIDGITSVETICICLGIVFLVSFVGVGPGSPIAPIAVVLAASVCGFLILNWHPAKIFLGDVGSVSLGFVLGWLLLSLAAAGYWAAALILPMYYLTDATVTLLRRLLRGEKIWQAHREHYYQYAVHNGKSHSEVAAAIAIANGLLMILALLSVNGWEYWLLVAAFGVVAFLVFWMLKDPPKPSSAGTPE